MEQENQNNQNRTLQLRDPKVLQFPSLVSPKEIYRGRQIMEQKRKESQRK